MLFLRGADREHPEGDLSQGVAGIARVRLGQDSVLAVADLLQRSRACLLKCPYHCTMNLDRIKKSVGHRVHLVPPACRLDEYGRELAPIDDAWTIEDVTDAGVRIANPRTGHFTTLGNDHIHHFTSNPALSQNGVPHGFFVLNVQLFLQGLTVSVTPNGRPGERVAPAPPRIREAIVDIRFPADSRMQAKLNSLGYEIRWCLEPRVARLTELEGWELTLEPDGSGGYVSYRLKDRPADQLLVKRVIPPERA